MAFCDKDLIKKRFASHLKEYDELSVTQRYICKKLADKLLAVTSEYPDIKGNAYEIGAGTGFLTKYILDNYSELNWYINDLVPETEGYINNIISQSKAKNVSCVWGDAEQLRLIDDVSMLVSCSAMQWFNSIEKYLHNIYPSIAKGGWVAFSIFGLRNFLEVRESSGGVGLEYPTLKEVEMWAEDCGFEVVFSEDYIQKIYFETPSDVLSYIKQSGMNGNSSQKWTKNDYMNFSNYYTEHFSDNGHVTLTFNPMEFILRKR